MSRWLWDCEDVQEDLDLLVFKYKELGYGVTKEQAYDAWYLYSEYCSANWMYVGDNGDVTGSLEYLKEILSEESRNIIVDCSLEDSCKRYKPEFCKTCITYSEYI